MDTAVSKCEEVGRLIEIAGSSRISYIRHTKARQENVCSLHDSNAGSKNNFGERVRALQQACLVEIDRAAPLKDVTQNHDDKDGIISG